MGAGQSSGYTRLKDDEKKKSTWKKVTQTYSTNTKNCPKQEGYRTHKG